MRRETLSGIRLKSDRSQRRYSEHVTESGGGGGAKCDQSPFQISVSTRRIIQYMISEHIRWRLLQHHPVKTLQIYKVLTETKKN